MGFVKKDLHNFFSFPLQVDDTLFLNDPYLDDLWGIENKINPGKDINIKEVWKKGFTGSKDVVVAVVDTGIDYTHPDLEDNMWINKGEIPENAIDDDGNGFVDDIHGWDFANEKPNGQDDHNHGTHVAGIIGAKGNNGIGVVGVNWDVSLMSLKTFDVKGKAPLSRTLQALDYALKMKAQVISNSYSYPFFSRAFKKVVEKGRDQGVLFVASAGNSFSDNDKLEKWPASFQLDNVIAVGAMDQAGLRAYFSNYGRRSVHVFAPGFNIMSTVKEGNYHLMSGTSMAAPYVTGIIALLLSVHTDLNYKQIRDRLIWTSHLSEDLEEFSVSGGFVDALRALENEKNPIDKNDSRFWKNSKEISVSKPYFYKENEPVNFFLKAPRGAKRLAVRVSRFSLHPSETVKVFALKSLEDRKGVLLDVFQGYGKLVRPLVSQGGEAIGLRIEYRPTFTSKGPYPQKPAQKASDFSHR